MTTADAAGPDEAGFAGLGLRPELLEALTALGYEEPTPIQREAIPPLLERHDVLGQAATGTGKTAAFALPLLHQFGQSADGSGSGPAALVLVPTRELAEQVSQAVDSYGKGLGVRVLPVYGGTPIGRQVQVLRRGVDIVVGTPGRVLDHIARETIDLSAVRTVVLDEADEMLDMGFAEDIEAILDETPAERQTVLFSATMPPRIDAIARKHLREPVRIQTGRPQLDPGELPKVKQSAYMVARAHKPAALGRILDIEAPTAAIVFCRTREEVDELTEVLNGRGYRAEALHGGLSQDQRDRVMGRLRAGTTQLLVATDVAARGLDIEQLTHVVNYNVPSAPEAYVHRIGRVGRAGRQGAAITLAEPREQRMLTTIERLTRQPIAIEDVPSVAELRARRLARTQASIERTLGDDVTDLDRFRGVLAELTSARDIEEVALAAIKMLHEASGGDGDDTEIPAVARTARDRGRERPGRDWSGRDSRDGRGRDDRGRPARGRPANAGSARLFLGIGRRAGLRPQDMVGAIAGESGLNARDIGAIEIQDRFSLVEVPERDADMVIAALRGATIRGRKATVRRERPYN
ncbi:DEAD/DEAH box helicase [Symbioplanes lichenis]|uniref:DEAD/DEAH box helicase n=1 Tax=Symbioplanes lichenis TaxID=1629072 RepID=UPI0027382164|nr:DEAD/DEAH box helicase [Actinoplanes lichenis]